MTLTKINLNVEKMSSLSSNIKVHVLKLKENQDLFKELDKFVKKNNFKAAFILTCVGSLANLELGVLNSNGNYEVS
jgi:predicted DNA-binding protein with PD1-like motif